MGEDHGRIREAAQPAELARLAAAARTQIGAENFPVALRILPRAPRDALTRVYAFARFVDDVGDESAGDRPAALDLLDAQVCALWAGQRATLAPVAGLAPLAGKVALQPFRDLIEANRIDQRVHRYETFADLLGYCAYSAAPVGRVVLQVAGVSDHDQVARSDAVCNGLQVLEHCQDVGEDARAGRIYLPTQDLGAAGVTEAELLAATTSAALRDVLALQVQRAESLLAAGRLLVAGLHGWARLAVAGYVAGGLATADALRAADCDVLARAVVPGKAATAKHAVRLLAGRSRT
jgi:squalene synthase HpnC